MINQKFIEYATVGNLLELNNLLTLPLAQIQDMLRADDFGAFRYAAENGHLSILERLLELPEAPIQAMVSACEFSAFYEAATNGHLPVMELLMKLAPDQIQNMVSADNYYAFREAAAEGHLPVIQRIAELALALDLDLIQQMMQALDYYAFCSAAQNGHLSTINLLVQFAPNLIQNMLSARDFFGFGEAAIFGHLPVIERIVELAPNLIPAMLSVDDYYAFRGAAENGHLPVIERLMQLAQSQSQAMLSARGFYAFHVAIANRHHQVFMHFLGVPFVFGYAEHQVQYERLIQTVVTRALLKLRQDTSAFNDENPSAVFDITNKAKIRFYFYVMRNLIRQNTAESIDQLRFLLNIPSLAAEAHKGDTIRNVNELLRLAMSINNHDAFKILFDIPNVRSNHLRHWEDLQRLDLEPLTRDTESSIHALSSEEKKRLRKAMAVYQPKVAERGVLVIMEDLKACMRAHYAKLPAMLTTAEGRLMPLPIEFQEFAQERFSPADRAQALRSYYQHPVHSSYRYLSKPNLWMHPAAEYVHRDKDGRAWSTFEDFQELIALLYLAAIDEQAPPIDDFTIETRVEHFLIELALIGRAHNWDATDREEEYDDLGADQPSCSIGVKKRLLQSVKGHPLLDMLSESIIDIEVRRIVKDHFTSHINDENCEALHQEWVAICEEGRVSASSSHLFSLNFTPSERDQHIASILEKYGPRLDQALQSYLHRRFQIEEPFNNLAEKFGGEINLTAMLEEKRKTHSQAQHLEQASSIVGGSFFKQADAPKYDDAIQIYPSKRSRNE